MRERGSPSPTTGRLPRVRAEPGRAHRARASSAAPRHCRPPARRADRRRADRRRGARAGGRWCRCDLPADLDLDDLVHRLNKLCRAGDRRAWRRRGPATTSTPGSRAVWRHYRYDVLERAGAEPAARRPGVVRRPSRSPRWAMQAACDPLIGEHDFSSFCRRPKVERRPSEPSPRPAGARRRAWSEVADDASATCASRSAPTPSATRWCARSSARSSTSASARPRPATSGAILAGPGPRRGRPGGPAARPHPVGGRLLNCPSKSFRTGRSRGQEGPERLAAP